LPGNGQQRLPRLDHLRQAAEQTPGVRVLRVAHHIGGEALFHHRAGVHHIHPVAELRHQRHVVGDQQDGSAFLPGLFAQQQQHLALYGHVQRGGGFVGNQQLRFAGERQGNHYPLAHAP